MNIMKNELSSKLTHDAALFQLLRASSHDLVYELVEFGSTALSSSKDKGASDYM